MASRLIAVVAVLALASGAVASDSAAGSRSALKACGPVSSRYGKFKVDVLHGSVACATARHVIRFVLTHGSGSQGAPGKSPPHWSCGWGFGYYHGHRNQMGRSGPICTRGNREVEGTGPEFTQEPTARSQALL